MGFATKVKNRTWQMFTNGMSETMLSEVSLMDVSPEAFKAMLEFMYSGGLDMEVIMDSSALLLQLLFFGGSIWSYSPSSGMLQNTFRMPLGGSLATLILANKFDFPIVDEIIVFVCHYHSMLLV
jgi:hypothetical protein